MDNEVLTLPAFELDTKVKILKRNINSGFLELARFLKEIRDNQLYKDLDYGTFESYIAQPELAFSRRSVYRFIQIYEKFVLELEIEPARLSTIDYSKLEKVLPYVDETNKEEWLSKAETLSLSDLDEEVKDDVPTLAQTKPEEIEVINLHPVQELSKSQEQGEVFTVSYLEVQKLFKKLASFQPDMQTMIINISNQYNGEYVISVRSDKPIPTKQIKQPSCPNKEEGHKGCIQFIDSLAESRGVKFPNYPKQIGALHKILKVGYTWDQINAQVDRMEKDKFWSQRGFDIANIMNELGKGGDK